MYDNSERSYSATDLLAPLEMVLCGGPAPTELYVCISLLSPLGRRELTIVSISAGGTRSPGLSQATPKCLPGLRTTWPDPTDSNGAAFNSSLPPMFTHPDPPRSNSIPGEENRRPPPTPYCSPQTFLRVSRISWLHLNALGILFEARRRSSDTQSPAPPRPCLFPPYTAAGCETRLFSNGHESGFTVCRSLGYYHLIHPNNDYM